MHKIANLWNKYFYRYMYHHLLQWRQFIFLIGGIQWCTGDRPYSRRKNPRRRGTTDLAMRIRMIPVTAGHHLHVQYVLIASLEFLPYFVRMTCLGLCREQQLRQSWKFQDFGWDNCIRYPRRVSVGRDISPLSPRDWRPWLYVMIGGSVTW